jgi:hypothetical protein
MGPSPPGRTGAASQGGVGKSGGQLPGGERLRGMFLKHTGIQAVLGIQAEWTGRLRR